MVPGNLERELKDRHPPPTLDSTQMNRPIRSTIGLHIAKPMPAPKYSPLACIRWNIVKIRWSYFESMPMTRMHSTRWSLRSVVSVAGDIK